MFEASLMMVNIRLSWVFIQLKILTVLAKLLAFHGYGLWMHPPKVYNFLWKLFLDGYPPRLGWRNAIFSSLVICFVMRLVRARFIYSQTVISLKICCRTSILLHVLVEFSRFGISISHLHDFFVRLTRRKFLFSRGSFGMFGIKWYVETLLSHQGKFVSFF